MPIFQDDFSRGRRTPPETSSLSQRSQTPLEERVPSRKTSEESIRTDLCEGHVPDSSWDCGRGNVPAAMDPPTTIALEAKFQLQGTSNRVELIQRLKRGESPTWLPNRKLESLLQNCESTSSPLLPSPELPNRRPSQHETTQAQAGLQIERPKSALHSGDFTERLQEDASRARGVLQAKSNLFNSEQSPWTSTSPPRDFPPFALDPRFPPACNSEFVATAPSRAPSLSSSFSSSFILKPPTSPLVQSENNDALDFTTQVDPIDIAAGSRRNTRRYTLQGSHPIHSIPSVSSTSSFSRPMPSMRRDSTFPSQAHQPRRSSTFHQPPHPTSPQTPLTLHSRRPSYTDNSPLHASMVGSYEESILRGRMSTTPSKPLDFVAQIGVLGLGKCKSSLRCPAHVTVPFPAVFYSYETTSHGRMPSSEDGPSPYVGQIDLENSLPHLDDVRDSKRKRATANTTRQSTGDIDMLDGPRSNRHTEREIRRAEKQKRRSSPSRTPPGGSYRIPEKGQLQIIIKNPNKTAVKLFLVPYDLAGMEAGNKTFIRQRIYSAGPIIDLGSSARAGPAPSLLDRPTLRYLVHLHICCTSRGRFYLYKSIRVVFANRVPDDKEKLRTEISLPEPRFSIYKPDRDSGCGLALNSGAGASLAAEKAYRRRSSGFPLGRTFDAMDGITQALETGFSAGSPFTYGHDSNTAPVQPIPFSLYRKPLPNDGEIGEEIAADIQSPSSSRSSQPPHSRGSANSLLWDDNGVGLGGYDKLSKGDVGYGGNAFGASPDGKQAGEGLLAQKLRDLGVGLESHQGPFNED